MREADCTRLAKAAIQECCAKGETISWSGEFADGDSLRPDGLVIERNGFLGRFFGDGYCLHAIESKVDRRYFSEMTNETYPEALQQLLDYHGNAKWLSVAHETLDEYEWDLLEEHCDDAGAGLICCYSRSECTVMTEPDVKAGDYWREYQVLCELMARQGWKP